MLSRLFCRFFKPVVIRRAYSYSAGNALKQPQKPLTNIFNKITHQYGDIPAPATLQDQLSPYAKAMFKQVEQHLDCKAPSSRFAKSS